MYDPKIDAEIMAQMFGLDDPDGTVAKQRELEAKAPWRVRPAAYWIAVLAEYKALAAEPRPEFFEFYGSGDAYDACQCDARIKTGDMLVIEAERVVGLAWAWPVAITAEHGELHAVLRREVVTAASPAGMGASEEQLAAAIAYAKGREWPVDPVFL